MRVLCHFDESLSHEISRSRRNQVQLCLFMLDHVCLNCTTFVDDCIRWGHGIRISLSCLRKQASKVYARLDSSRHGGTGMTQRDKALIETAMMLDIDYFKSYNDTFGHVEGGSLLREVGQILKTSLRASDVVCRYAGDEFAVILPDADTDGADKAAEKIVKAVARQAFKRKVTVSLGVTCYDGNMTQTQFIEKAGKALYQAEQEGRDR